jgi:CheY-like chemotaxis protein
VLFRIARSILAKTGAPAWTSLSSWWMMSLTWKCFFGSNSGTISVWVVSRWNLLNPGDMALRRIVDAKGVSLILILSDINMPGMTGLELLPKAKAARPDVPVIMITAYGDAETKRKALENGADALFTKPIDFGALRSEIDMRVARAA